MIRKLRRKFVLVNMMLVTLVLLIVFSILVVSSYQTNIGKSYDTLHQAVNAPDMMRAPFLDLPGRTETSSDSTNHSAGDNSSSTGAVPSTGSEAGSGASQAPDSAAPGTQSDSGQRGDESSNRFSTMIPVFSVTLDSSNQIIHKFGANVSMSDELVNQAVTEVLAAGTTQGVLSDLNLRYLVNHDSQQTVIAFADQRWEQDSMKDLILMSLLVGAVALLGFFAISVFLSGIAVRPVDEAWRRQQQFLADASHELKTPLTVILADTNILMSHPQETVGNQIKWVEYIQNEAERMKQLVQDMLFLAKGDAAKLEHQHSVLSLTDLVWSSLLPFESVAFEQGVTLDAKIAPELMISGNETQLQRLVMILLDNACKYAGHPGVVTVSLSHLQDKICLSVHNTGEPIPPDRLSHVFERFFRVDTARTRQTGGYGLGLAIAQTITVSHRGKLSVESSQDHGTTFSVLFPEPKN
jgi:two-component system sensor histidine kinase CiaH